MTARMDKERLAAFVDDELSPEEAARVVLHLADCPEDQAYVDRITVDRELLARAFADIAADPLPEGLRTLLVEEAPAEPAARVIPLRRRPTRVWAGVGGLAAAAAIALAVYVGLDSPSGDVELAAGPAEGVVEAALDGLGGGESRALGDGATLEMASSFADARGRLCRELVLRSDGADGAARAVACTGGGGWTVEIVVAEEAPAGDADAFLPADGPGQRALDRLLDDIGAGLALTPEEEEEARARGWRP